MKFRNLLFVVLGGIVFTLHATSASAVNFSISVAVTGLNGGTLVLQDSKLDTLTFTSDTTQTFAKTYGSGSSYQVRVQTQPS